MASIFKRSKAKGAAYSIQYTDHLGKRRTAKGFTDKGLTEQLAAKLESDARMRATGLIDATQERIVQQLQSPIGEHLGEFEESLTDNTAKHVQLTMTRVRRIVSGCKFERLADIRPDVLQTYLRGLRKSKKIGHRTHNHYVQAFDSFCNWCVVTRRVLSNPILGAERLNAEVDVRRKRRALTSDEVGKLIAAARASGIRIQRFTGEQRARIYLLSYMTGLRKNELASLSPRSFNLGASPPTVTVEARNSKHRKKDVLPLHPELVVQLRDWLEGVRPTEKLFPNLAGRKTWLMVQKDLARAGIEYITEEGVADFHAAGRHSHIIELLRNGASLPEAKELARHSDVKMTMRYTHIGLNDQARAVANLPAPRSNPQPALQMRCISGVVDGQKLSTGGSDAADQKRENPCRNRGLGVDRHSMSDRGNLEAAGIEPAS